MNRIDLNGQTAIVTGAARGLGLAISEKLVQCGANVSMWDTPPLMQRKMTRLARGAKCVGFGARGLFVGSAARPAR